MDIPEIMQNLIPQKSKPCFGSYTSKKQHGVHDGSRG